MIEYGNVCGLKNKVAELASLVKEGRLCGGLIGVGETHLRSFDTAPDIGGGFVWSGHCEVGDVAAASGTGGVGGWSRGAFAEETGPRAGDSPRRIWYTLPAGRGCPRTFVCVCYGPIVRPKGERKGRAGGGGGDGVRERRSGGDGVGAAAAF